VYAMVIGRLPFCSPFKDEYHRQRMLRHIQKGLAPFHDREMASLCPGTVILYTVQEAVAIIDPSLYTI